MIETFHMTGGSGLDWTIKWNSETGETLASYADNAGRPCTYEYRAIVKSPPANRLNINHWRDAGGNWTPRTK